MTRIRASVLFACIAIAKFVFEQLQRLSDSQLELFTIVPILLVVIALLTLVLSTRTIVVYGSVVLIATLLFTGTDLVNESTSGTSKALSFLGGLISGVALYLLLRQISRATWVQSRRYLPVSDDPWVSLDKGIDPTIGSGKEGQ